MITDAAEAYDRHVGRYGSQLAADLIGVAGVRPGNRVLDVGCDPGPLTSALADVVGPRRLWGPTTATPARPPSGRIGGQVGDDGRGRAFVSLARVLCLLAARVSTRKASRRPASRPRF